MIDIENELYTIIANKLRSDIVGIFVAGENVKTPATFPAVMFREISNSVYEKSQSNLNIENHASLGYEFSVYSNKASGKKTECKKIAAIIDEEMLRMGFTRTSLETIDNTAEPSIYRMVGRYKAVVSKNKTIYRR